MTNLSEVFQAATKNSRLRELANLEALEREQREHDKKSFKSEGDSFTNTNMKEITKLIEGMNDTTLGYLLIIQSYLRYDGTLGTTKTPFTKVKDFEGILNLKTRKIKDVISKLTEKGVLYLNEDKVYCMNPIYHFRGKVPRSQVKNNIKLIINSIRALRDAQVKAKDLSAVYFLLPYVTYGHNILASNPNERQLEKIDTLNLKQISTIIGVADTNKVLQKIRRVTFEHERYGTLYAFAQVRKGDKEYHFKANPLLMRRVSEREYNLQVPEVLIADFIVKSKK